MDKSFVKKLFGCILGCFLVGWGTSCMNAASFGNDSYSALINSIAMIFNLIDVEWIQNAKYLIANIAFNLLALIPMAIVMPKKINIGTLINVVGIGFMVDLFDLIFKDVGWVTASLELWQRAVFSIFGFFLVCYGIALFVQADLGISPYDAINLMLAKRFTYKYGRIISDFGCALVAFIISLYFFYSKITSVGSFFRFLFIDPDDKVGWFTVVSFFAMGPVISMNGKFINRVFFKNPEANI